MDKLLINGNKKMRGTLKVHGSKNSSLPIMISSLLTSQYLKLSNVPDVDDTKNMLKLLKIYGAKIKKEKKIITINCQNIKNITADYDIVRKMRASVLILGPLLSRFGEAKISLPGGCAIGTRPVDLHLSGLSRLGVKFKIENGFIFGSVSQSLIGNKIILPFPSVGATENILMASVLAKGETLIQNAAKEPEIDDLGNCLIRMGAKIKGLGTNKIYIQGVSKLKKASHKIISDRIVAGTFLILAVMINNKIEIKNLNIDHLKSIIKVLKNMGANLEIFKNSIIVNTSNKLKSTSVVTAPYPGFPTDLQAQLMSLMSLVNGNSKIKETVFENRFMHVPELNRLGAKIQLNKDIAFIQGNQKFKGAQVMASDLRASVSLVLAALCGSGQTIINRVYHLDRGYEKIEKCLILLGAEIKRLKN